jgi:MinD-like ATPase involved in chromosome partitioning or flagellar assembly
MLVSGNPVPESGCDQAEGLRRLFRRTPPSAVAFVGVRTGCGATRVAGAFARRLAARGLSVTLVDEHRGEAGATALLNARARFDLWQVINGDALITQAVVLGMEGLRLVPAARLAQQRNALDAAQQTRLEQCWRVVSETTDLFVIDALLGNGGRLSPLVSKVGALVVVSGTDSAAVMGAYLMLKQIVPAHPHLRLGLVVNPALTVAQAAAIADNLHGLLRDQVGRELTCFGWLPRLPVGHAGAHALVPAATEGLASLDMLLPDGLQHSPDDAMDASCQIPLGRAPLTPVTAA